MNKEELIHKVNRGLEKLKGMIGNVSMLSKESVAINSQIEKLYSVVKEYAEQDIPVEELFEMIDEACKYFHPVKEEPESNTVMVNVTVAKESGGIII